MSVVSDVERQLEELRQLEGADGTPDLRTSVMTHIAWAPPKWAAAARRTLAGLEERHPSRTILLFPEPRGRDGVDVAVTMQCFAMHGVSHEVCSEVIELRLGGKRAQAPASIVQPLLISDLPTFCRWRGEPPWGKPELEQLVDVCDRLVVDSSEWTRLPAAYEKSGGALRPGGRLGHRVGARRVSGAGGLAELWPEIKKAERLSVTGPKADAVLLVGWLRSRLRREVALTRRSAEELARVAVDGVVVDPPLGGRAHRERSALGRTRLFGRDPIYEAAVEAA